MTDLYEELMEQMPPCTAYGHDDRWCSYCEARRDGVEVACNLLKKHCVYIAIHEESGMPLFVSRNKDTAFERLDRETSRDGIQIVKYYRGEVAE